MASMIEITVHVPRSDQAHEFLLPREIALGDSNTALSGRADFLAVARRQIGAATCPASTCRSRLEEMRD
jgi:hypothetical protein